MEQNPGKTYAIRAAIELRKKILSGDLPGGMRLFEVPLAVELKISRTPVREALLRLAEEGLLERVRNGGFIVRTFRLSDVIDAIELRGVMEGTAARLAAERGVPPPMIARMHSIVASLDECFGPMPGDVDFESYRDLNAVFHKELAGLCGSDIVQREVERATRFPFASPSAFLQERADVLAFRRSLNTAQEQHRAVVLAIEEREGFRAEALAREHARAARRNLEYVMNEDRTLIGHVPGLALVK